MLVAWAGREEFSTACNEIFLDERARRAVGLRCVDIWRLRGLNALPLSADATATFAELMLLDNISENALCLMHGMAITRLVNGIVDPLQRGAHAASIKRLALTVRLPSALVELRHECTHNRIPSLGRLRLATDHALFWLRENYWLPQVTLRAEMDRTLHDVLCDYRAGTVSRCAAGEPHLRKHVLACSAGLEKSCPIAQLGMRLVPMLLDTGLFVHPPPVTTYVPFITHNNARLGKAADSTDSSPELLRRVWVPLLTRLSRLWPKHNIRISLLLAASQRLREEGDALPPSHGATRLLALQGWCMHLLDTASARAPPEAEEDNGGVGVTGFADSDPQGEIYRVGMSLSEHVLVRVVWFAVQAQHGWGRPVVLHAARHSAWASEELPGRAKRLVQLQDAVTKVREDGTRLPSADNDADERVIGWLSPHITLETTTSLVATTLAPPLARNGAWLVCSHWVPLPIGGEPPSSMLVAVFALCPEKPPDNVCGLPLAEGDCYGDVSHRTACHVAPATETASRTSGRPGCADVLPSSHPGSHPEVRVLYRRCPSRHAIHHAIRHPLHTAEKGGGPAVCKDMVS